MSLPRSNYDPRRVCLNPFPDLHLGKYRRNVGVYLAGALFAIANWIFLDHARVPWGDEPPVHVKFVDWVPGICSLLGYLVVNLIDKDRIKGDEGFGFALMAGGLAGSVVDYAEMFKYYGYANVIQNFLIMVSAAFLWMAQSTSGEYEYNVTL
ncbi:UPF0220-domain-containing protein [Gymnopus androsaceus JB14]|uniref:UPF0220-domain-containing protein n=1 Tax=Gymnopus androsaceus JB14 TaxID=1447944 RepID=A0A6A4HV54_9AGAR|nr:UPF0220-domain-containing protein [Gymnopus androsaceus JB14]